MKRIVASEAFIVTILSILALTLSALPWFIKLATIPAGRDMIPIHNSLSDYPFYVSVIREGIDGSRAVFDRYAIEPHAGSVIHLFYLLIGWVAGIIGITSAHLAYHLSRFILGAVWCLVIYWLCDTFVKEKWVRILAVFFALFSASFPKFIFVNGQLTVQWFMTWWSELNPTVRAAFVPHFLLGHITMVAALISLINYEKHKRNIWLVRAGLSGFLAAFVHPPSAIQLFLMLPFFVLLVRSKPWFIGTLILLTSAGIGLAVINSISNVFPWNLPKAYEGVSFAVPTGEYLLALGPVGFLAVIGCVSRFKKRETWLLILWIVTSLVAVPLSKQMPFSAIAIIRNHPISNIRFLQVALWVPLAILGAYGLAFIFRRNGKIAGAVTLCIFIFLTFAGYPATIQEQVSHIYFSSEYLYPKKGYLEGLSALGTVTKPDGNILSLSLAGMTIPMYVNRTSYVGQVVYTPQLDEKMKLSWKFFAGGMGACEAYTFLKTNRIGAVFYSFDEANAGGNIRNFPFLQSWNRYGETEVFTVVDSPPAGCR